MSFVHLHTHSHYSLLDGIPKIPELVSAVQRMGMPAVALTDHGNLYGAIEFYQEAKAHGIKPIIGIEAYVAPKTIADRDPRERPYHLILLAENTTGYENLVQLATIAHLEGFYYKPRIDFDLLSAHREGLIVLSGCLSGELARAVRNHDMQRAEAVAHKFYTVFGPDRYFMEVQHNPHTPDQAVVNSALLELHHRLGIPLVATADSHYIHLEDREAQDVLVCIQTKSLLSDTSRLSMRDGDYSLATAQHMRERFIDFPGAVDNTLKIAERVNIELQFGVIQMPAVRLPDSVNADERLRELCVEGVQRRFGTATPAVLQRLEYELDVIQKTGFASYFLIVQDFVNWAKQQGIAVGPGRGSAAGSLVSYLTNITDIDPIHYQLLFERFLNPERVSQPDIDTDFADIRRDDVLRYVEEKYGKDHVAQIITFGTMAARAAVRDVGRVMGFSYGYCDRIAKMIPMFATLHDALAHVPELATLVAQDPDAERLLTVAKKLEGVARHTSTHACAVVITKGPLTKHVPLQYADAESRTVITQYSMKPIEALGLLKMDFLGLKNLTIIEKTLDEIAASLGVRVDMNQISLQDDATFALLQAANTIGVFQLESSGMRRYLKQLQPTEFEDIIAMVSLYRPGPMEFIPHYIDGKHGRRAITYLDERLKPILSRTYGIAVYQEQVSEIARQLAGFSYGQADTLRKAVAKKNKALLDEQGALLMEGMVRHGITKNNAQKIWDFILPFARYGFNRSHAACYAMIAYRTAYLKAHYPAQFMAALLSADHADSDRVAIEVHHAQSLGIRVLPPDVNESQPSFSVVVRGEASEKLSDIRFGLQAIKNLGEHIIDVIIAERNTRGPFRRLEDLLSRVHDKDLNKKSLESLIKVGALDSLGERNQMLMNIDVLLQYAKRQQAEVSSGQRNLFGALAPEQQPRMTLSPAPPVRERTKLDWEKELLGLFLSGHPLEPHASALQYLSSPFNTLKEHPSGRQISLIGMVTSVKRVTTKAGEPMFFVGFADHTAEIEGIVFPKVLKRTTHLWVEDSLLMLRGTLDDKDGTVKILVEEAQTFRPEQMKLYVVMPAHVKKTTFIQVTELLRAHPGDVPAFLAVQEKTIDTHTTVSLQCAPKIQQLLGHEAVRVVA